MIANIAFMAQLEDDYRRASGLRSRKHYKIFYGQVFPAPILTLGLNPGGDPAETSADGTRQNDGLPASASASFFEGMENDVLDCEWRENAGLRRLLLPVVGQDRNRFRHEIVKTNISFRRSRGIGDINLTAAAREAAPFLRRIIARVRPQVIVLTGSFMDCFLRLHAIESVPVGVPERLNNAPAFVFSAASTRLEADNLAVIIVQVGHASRFAWTYDRHHIPEEIGVLMCQTLDCHKDTALLAPNCLQPLQSAIGGRTTTMPHNWQTDLAELGAEWWSLGIAAEFWRVHHFRDPKFSGKHVSLETHIKHCRKQREIGIENAETLKRGLDVAKRVKAGQPLHTALNDAWAAFPVLTR